MKKLKLIQLYYLPDQSNKAHWRTPNTASTAVFDGKVVVDTIGSGLLVQDAAGLQLDGGMELDSHLVVRPHRTSVSLTVLDLNLGTSDDLIFRTLVSDNNTQNLSVGTLFGILRLHFSSP